MAGIITINTHLKGVLDLRSVFDIEFLFIVDIWYDVHNGSRSILISISYQNVSVSTTSSDLVDLCPNLWCNNPKENFFLGIWFCDFDFTFILPKIYVFFVHCAVMSPRSVLYHWRKKWKTLMKKSDMYQIYWYNNRK